MIKFIKYFRISPTSYDVVNIVEIFITIFTTVLDSPSLWLTTCIQGHDERGRLMRRTIMRYINLSLILTLRLICLPVKKRFPHYDHLVEAGILEKGEKKVIYRLTMFVQNYNLRIDIHRAPINIFDNNYLLDNGDDG